MPDLKPSRRLTEVLKRNAQDFAPVMEGLDDPGALVRLNLSKRNPELAGVVVSDSAELARYIEGVLQRSGARFAVGGWNEERGIYPASLFGTGEEPRTVHMAIDVWAPKGTAVMAPLEGYLESFKNNNQRGDYGGTLIVRHEVDGVEFRTLYGHLSESSLIGKRVGQRIYKGQVIGMLGNEEENGNWPPHLHFQIINNGGGRTKGDFPGVVPRSQRRAWREISPDPARLLRVNEFLT